MSGDRVCMEISVPSPPFAMNLKLLLKKIVIILKKSSLRITNSIEISLFVANYTKHIIRLNIL